MSVIKDHLDLDFTTLQLDQQHTLEPFLKHYPQPLTGYTFASLMAWSQVYSYDWKFFEKDTLIISPYIEEDHHRHLLQPIGAFPKSCQDYLLQMMHHLDYPCKIYGVPNVFMDQYPQFCSHFTDKNDPSHANYIYRTVDLATLSGRRYDKKRNLISQAEHLYNWSTYSLTEKCKPQCCKILLDIGPQTSSDHPKELQKELIALEYIMAHFIRLKLKGCMLCIDDKPVAFSIYDELNPSTADVYFEKAQREFKGLYQLINRETAKAILHDGYEFINREEDLGLEGLRKAKSSYFPINLVSSHTLTYKGSGKGSGL